MAIGRTRFAKGDRVIYDGKPATVLNVGGGKVQIRDVFGYKQAVKPGQLTKQSKR